MLFIRNDLKYRVFFFKMKVVFGFEKVLRKEKTIKKNNFLKYDFTI